MNRIRVTLMATLLAILAACATPPPEAPAPPRDLLVELGDAEAAGDRDAMLSLASDLLADPATDDALTLDLADLLAREGETARALAAYQTVADTEAAAPSRTGPA